MVEDERLAGDQLKGHLPTLVLSILASEPAHGYAVMPRLAERSRGAFELGQGAIYPLLYRLEAERLIRSKTQTVNGRRRRVYALTAKGRRRLEVGRRRWRSFAAAVNAVLATT